jgi:hypothetical protein
LLVVNTPLLAGRIGAIFELPRVKILYSLISAITVLNWDFVPTYNIACLFSLRRLKGNNMDLQITSLFGLLIFIADIWAILNIIQSQRPPSSKLLWVLLILFLPVIGLIIWWINGPREKS